VRELAADLLAPPADAPEKAKGRAAKGREAEVRTKTMAALLAQQGDTAGAKAIYDELLAGLAPGAERAEIEALAAALSGGKASEAPDAAADTSEAASQEGDPAGPTRKSGGPAKLVNLLEALAGRLDARAGG
jgi:hypothetical protein